MILNSANEKTTILFVDDDRAFARAVSELLSPDYLVLVASEMTEASQIIFQQRPHLVLLDFSMPTMTGLEFLKLAKPRCPNTPFIMLTGESDPEKIIETMRAGASDYVIKGSDDFEASLKFRIHQVLRSSELRKEHDHLAQKFAKQFEILGDSQKTLKLRRDIGLLKNTNATVLISGENGTGKELVARNLNLQEGKSGRPFVAVNCAAISSNLFESEFFGHVKGAFTGASENKHGQFKVADGGDIFLDEIGEVPLELQAKLLRVLQERTFTPVGSTKPIQVNVRIIAATNRNLLKEVESGEFREDLYYRLNQFGILVPPLRERADDILILAESFLQRDLPMASFTDKAKAELLEYSWPGNIRELTNVIERAKILVREARKPVIKPEHLVLDFQKIAPSKTREFPETIFPSCRDEITPERYQRALAWVEQVFLERTLSILRNDNRAAYGLLGMSKAHFFRRKKAAGLLDTGEPNQEGDI